MSTNEFLISMHWRNCPNCGEHKFIGHGPLCLDCWKASATGSGK